MSDSPTDTSDSGSDGEEQPEPGIHHKGKDVASKHGRRSTGIDDVRRVDLDGELWSYWDDFHF